MPDLQQTEEELRSARQDLQRDIAELKHEVRKKLDVRRQARAVFDRGRHRIAELGKQHRGATVGVVLGGLTLAVAVWIRRHRRSRRR